MASNKVTSAQLKTGQEANVSNYSHISHAMWSTSAVSSSWGTVEGIAWQVQSDKNLHWVSPKTCLLPQEQLFYISSSLSTKGFTLQYDVRTIPFYCWPMFVAHSYPKCWITWCLYLPSGTLPRWGILLVSGSNLILSILFNINTCVSQLCTPQGDKCLFCPFLTGMTVHNGPSKKLVIKHSFSKL